MSSEEFSDLVGARRVGSGRWQARCPAHRDTDPSLNIRAGSDGRVLLHCFAGCALDSILAALKLTRRDLFTGPPASAAEVRRMALERDRKETESSSLRRAHGVACDRLRKLERVAESLGDKLAREPDDADAGAALARLFHATLDKARVAEARELELRP